MVVVKGRVSFRDEAPKIIVSEVQQIDEAYKAVTSINVDLSGVNEEDLRVLREKLSQYPGKVPVYLRLDTNAYKSVQILVGEDLFVSPSESLMNDLKDLIGASRFSLSI